MKSACLACTKSCTLSSTADRNDEQCVVKNGCFGFSQGAPFYDRSLVLGRNCVTPIASHLSPEVLKWLTRGTHYCLYDGVPYSSNRVTLCRQTRGVFNGLVLLISGLDALLETGEEVYVRAVLASSTVTATAIWRRFFLPGI